MSVFSMLSQMTQLERIAWHLNKYREIDDTKARDWYGDRRVSDKILKLRNKGINIESVRKVCTNRFGDKSRYCIYVLRDKKINVEALKRNE